MGAGMSTATSEARVHFYCGCGFIYHGDDVAGMDGHESLSCCNCGGQKCMDCVLRYIHADCADDCPDCC